MSRILSASILPPQTSRPYVQDESERYVPLSETASRQAGGRAAQRNVASRRAGSYDAEAARAVFVREQEVSAEARAYAEIGRRAARMTPVDASTLSDSAFFAALRGQGQIVTEERQTVPPAEAARIETAALQTMSTHLAQSSQSGDSANASGADSAKVMRKVAAAYVQVSGARPPALSGRTISLSV